MITQFQISARTDVGRARDHNEDNFIVCPDLAQTVWHLKENPHTLTSSGCLLVVADGMGGTNAGEVASETAVESVRDYFKSLLPLKEVSVKQAKEYLVDAVLRANEAIVLKSQQNPAYTGMGTTIILAWLLKGKAVLAWSGDSRAYHLKKDQSLTIATKDHSLVWELVESGKLTPAEADQHPDSNIITQSLGDRQHPPRPDTIVLELAPEDRLLLCSDGLNNMLNSTELEEILKKQQSVDELTRELIDQANAKGGKDNITAILIALMPEQADVGSRKGYYYETLMVSLLFLLFLIFWGVFSINVGNADPTEQHLESDAEALMDKAPGGNNEAISEAVSPLLNSLEQQGNILPPPVDSVANPVQQLPHTKEETALLGEAPLTDGTGNITINSATVLDSTKIRAQAATVQKVVRLVESWEALENRINAERLEKNTKHNTDSADADSWLLLDQKQSQVKEILDKYDLRVLVGKYKLHQIADSLSLELQKHSPQVLESDLLKAEKILANNKAIL